MDNRLNRLMGVTCAELRAGAGDSRSIEGYAIVFGQESVPMWTDRGKPAVETIARDAVTSELLEASDIKMTMYHDMQRLLARSKRGSGTLAMGIDDKGVWFRFDAPRTMYGDEALELVRSGDIDGCSFMFTTDYGSEDCVSRERGKEKTVFTVRKITGLYDFTLTPDPAYPQTQCAARSAAMEDEAPAETPDEYKSQIAEMRKEIETLTNEI